MLSVQNRKTALRMRSERLQSSLATEISYREALVNQLEKIGADSVKKVKKRMFANYVMTVSATFRGALAMSR
jgi:hypothetical protein